MFKIKPALRLAITIGFLSATVVWAALALGFVPDPSEAETKRRKSIARSVAVTVSGFVRNQRRTELKWMLEQNLAMEPDLISIGIRKSQIGKPFLEVGPHQSVWAEAGDAGIVGHQFAVDIMANRRKWGQMEIVFAARKQGWLAWIWSYPNGLIVFVMTGLTLLTWAVLSKTFRYLSPSQAVPDRVRSALDSIAGGLVLVSRSGEIAHANEAFCRIVNRDRDNVIGSQLTDFTWSVSADGSGMLPWEHCRTSQEAVSGEIVEAKIAAGVTQKYMVSASLIMGAGGNSRGMLVSFEDVTALESKKAELAKIIQAVRLSRDEVSRQNEQLNFLASYDPLTNCMNRRAFLANYEKAWEEDRERQLTVVMMDIDHFKSVNDNHGHSVGDEVLQKVGEIIAREVGDHGQVCRYGGEEFVMLLPQSELEQSCDLAEQIRLAIQADEISGLTITVSMGISTVTFGAMDPQHMLDQADQCLYVAKRNGRNQVVRFDQASAEDLMPSASSSSDEAPQETGSRPEEIAWSSVTGLLSALSFRDPSLAEHSVRVADMCVAIGESLLDRRDSSKLEISALLHEVGTVGFDNFEASQQDDSGDTEVMSLRRRDDVALAILRNSFASSEVINTIADLHAANSNQSRRLSDGVIESMSVRILKACDQLDTLVHTTDDVEPMDAAVAIRYMAKELADQHDPIVLSKLKDFVETGRFQTMISTSAASRDESSESCNDSGHSNLIESDELALESLLSLAAEVVELCKVGGGLTEKVVVESAAV